jgi:DNA-binding winged helix-turn-helix (wHTH) protein
MFYRFAEFTLDDDTRQLLCKGEEVHVTPKAFQLLQLLLANRARAMSKIELQQQIWPSTYVEETNLATLVAEIRRVLHDGAARPRFVRTVYGFGYRFVGDVTVSAAPMDREGPRIKLWLTFEGRQLPLMEGVNVIGRGPDAAIQIDSPGISRSHARIHVVLDDAMLEDLGSKNGTYLNGSRITTPCRLVDGNEIRLGGIVLTFRITSQASLTQTVPSGVRT